VAKRSQLAKNKAAAWRHGEKAKKATGSESASAYVSMKERKRKSVSVSRQRRRNSGSAAARGAVESYHKMYRKAASAESLRHLA
jgi:hypothetical protein